MAIRRRSPLAAAITVTLAVMSIASAEVYFEERFGGMCAFPIALEICDLNYTFYAR